MFSVVLSPVEFLLLVDSQRHWPQPLSAFLFPQRHSADLYFSKLEEQHDTHPTLGEGKNGLPDRRTDGWTWPLQKGGSKT